MAENRVAANKVGDRLTQFQTHGAVRFPAVLARSEASPLADRLAPLLHARPGARLGAEAGLHTLLDEDGPVGAVAASLIGPSAHPVRAVLFDKSAETNWVVAWHQDRTIAVRERIEVTGFGPWSRKDGVLHVAPQSEVFERMVTLRLHLDDCGEDSAPLVVALGSHLLGRVGAGDAEGEAVRHRQLRCVAAAGDVWAYSTAILHMSGRTRSTSRRRVLQVDYATCDLPGGLKWRGLG